MDDKTTVSTALHSGAADYLVKPLRRNELGTLWAHVWRRLVRQPAGLLVATSILHCRSRLAQAQTACQAAADTAPPLPAAQPARRRAKGAEGGADSSGEGSGQGSAQADGAQRARGDDAAADPLAPHEPQPVAPQVR